MATHERRWPLAQAQLVAEALRNLLSESCERIEVAGSIRRRKPDVGDCELLAIPCLGQGRDLWGKDINILQGVSLLDYRVLQLIKMGVLDYRLDAKRHRSFGPLNKYLVHVASGIPVDLFSTTTQNFGMALVVRTGPAAFNIRMMATFRQKAMLGHTYGGVSRDGREVPCPNEVDVFNLLGWPYIPPEKRALWR